MPIAEKETFSSKSENKRKKNVIFETKFSFFKHFLRQKNVCLIVRTVFRNHFLIREMTILI